MPIVVSCLNPDTTPKGGRRAKERVTFTTIPESEVGEEERRRVKRNDRARTIDDNEYKASIKGTVHWAKSSFLS